ncbi:MAG: hypothetical protein JXQ73_33965 [Phycisphaerae bacterium]|nr:hypothetical protein [Phycisphaerae bacterium]
MVARRTWIGLIACMLGFAGCGKQEQEPAPPTSANPAPTAEQVKAKAGEAVDAAKGFLAVKKDEALQSMETKLADLEKKLDELKKHADAKGQEAKAEYDKTKADLDKKIAETKEKLEKSKTATGEAWKSLKSGLDAAMGELDSAYEKAASRFKSDK